jgi:hypothetical protein
MKKLLIILLFGGLILTSCSDFNSSTEPEFETSSIELIRVPQKNNPLKTETLFTHSKEINGVLGGTINFSFPYLSTSGKSVNIYGKLTIPQNAFDYTTTISLVIDDEFAVIDLYPSPMSFDAPLKLSLVYEGINLNGLTQEQVEFYFIEDGTNHLELINSSEKLFENSTGKLGIIGAELPHFSRFGWSK